MPAWKVLLVSLGVSVIGIFLLYWLFSIDVHKGIISPSLLAGLLTIVTIPLILITAIASLVAFGNILLLGYVFITMPGKHFLVTKLGGIQTTATVISSEECDDSEDVCICGVYTYTDWRNREHSAKFRRCYHYPSKELWDEVLQLYGLGVQRQVYYLRWFPSIHEIQAKE
jgi:hypothetical protein